MNLFQFTANLLTGAALLVLSVVRWLMRARRDATATR
jgi:hypothetical protein